MNILESKIQEIAHYIMNQKKNHQRNAWTNDQIKELFPGDDYANAWRLLKQRGRRNETMFYEDGLWHLW